MSRALAVAAATLILAGAAPAKPDLQADFDSLVAAERAFSKLSEEKGIKDSFLANVADDAVVFRPGPVPGKEWLSAHPNPSAFLAWHPTFAAIARSGDLGWTTGPYEITLKDGRKGYGQYSTVWRKQPDGRWKFVVDLGIETPAAVPETGPPKLAAAAAPRQAQKIAETAPRESLLAADRDLGKTAAAQGLASAYAAAAADDAYLLRDGHPPFVGKEAIRGALAPDAGGVSWEPAGSGVSAAGDLGYLYGTAARKSPAETGVYMRVWQRQPGGPWKLALDVTKLEPVKPATPAEKPPSP
jgi:ketosteroid isomerase-like protein